MVLLHVKRSEKESFLYETPAATDVEVVLRELVTITLLLPREYAAVGNPR